MKPLRYRLDERGQNTYARPPSDTVNARLYGGAAAEVTTIPTNAKFAVFSSTVDFYAKPDAAAAVPTDDVTDGSASEMNPTIWDVEGLSTIGLAVGAAGIVTIAYYGGTE